MCAEEPRLNPRPSVFSMRRWVGSRRPNDRTKSEHLAAAIVVASPATDGLD